MRPRVLRQGERLSEYFDFEHHPEKADKRVTRLELQAILVAIEKQRWRRRTWRRFVRWIKREGP